MLSPPPPPVLGAHLLLNEILGSHLFLCFVVCVVAGRRGRGGCGSWQARWWPSAPPLSPDTGEPGVSGASTDRAGRERQLPGERRFERLVGVHQERGDPLRQRIRARGLSMNDHNPRLSHGLLRPPGPSDAGFVQPLSPTGRRRV